MLKLKAFLVCMMLFFCTAPTATAASLEELQEEYQHYQALVNNENVIWLSSPVAVNIAGVPSVKEGTHDRKKLQELIRTRILTKRGLTYDDYLSAWALIQDMSNQTKKRVREVLLPQLASQIKELGGTINPANEVVVTGDSFSDVMDSLTSDEHLSDLSFSNMDDVISTNCKCQKMNPGNKSIRKIYPNGRNSGSTYIKCGYHRNGTLDYEMSYVNGKLDGLFVDWNYDNRYGIHYVSKEENYSVGKLHGKKMTYKLSRSGDVYKHKLLRYSYGDLNGTSETYYENGETQEVTEYENGRAIRSNKFHKDGSFSHCTEWGDDRRPRDCTTGRLR